MAKTTFNVDYAKSVSQQEFVDHFKDVYPDLDLKAEYIALTGRSDKKSFEKEEKKEE